MKLDRLAYDPAALVDFYEEGFTALGALCERTWHDRLEVVAEGRAAKPWNPEGALHEVELTFAPADATTARDAVREVFPGCPLTFQSGRGPSPCAAGPGARRARRRRPPPGARTRRSGKALARAIPGHDALAAQRPIQGRIFTIPWWPWCVARFRPLTSTGPCAAWRCLCPSGEPDDLLAEQISFAQADPALAGEADWPAPDLARWEAALRTALEADLAPDMAAIRARQEQYLRRELDRIDDYFANYEHELATRAARSASGNVKLKTGERLGRRESRACPPARRPGSAA